MAQTEQKRDPRVLPVGLLAFGRVPEAAVKAHQAAIDERTGKPRLAPHLEACQLQTLKS